MHQEALIFPIFYRLSTPPLMETTVRHGKEGYKMSLQPFFNVKSVYAVENEKARPLRTFPAEKGLRQQEISARGRFPRL